MKTIENTSKRKLLVSLDHPAFYRKRWGFHRRTVRTFEHDAKSGARGILETRKPCPGVITLLAGEKRTGLPDEIVAVPDVKKHRAAGKLAVRETEAAPKAPAAAPSAPAETTDSPATTKSKSKRGK